MRPRSAAQRRTPMVVAQYSAWRLPRERCLWNLEEVGAKVNRRSNAVRDGSKPGAPRQEVLSARVGLCFETDPLGWCAVARSRIVPERADGNVLATHGYTRTQTVEVISAVDKLAVVVKVNPNFAPRLAAGADGTLVPERWKRRHIVGDFPACRSLCVTARRRKATP